MKEKRGKKNKKRKTKTEKKKQKGIKKKLRPGRNHHFVNRTVRRQQLTMTCLQGVI